MVLSSKTLEKLRILINEDTTYRSGPKLVIFFNQLGFNDSYGQGFPSRHVYTDDKLQQINGTPELDKCIKMLFAPVGYIGRFSDLDKFIKDFNQYIAFDGWEVIRKGQEILFQKSKGVDIDSQIENSDDDFLSKDFEDISITHLKIDYTLLPVLENRIAEIKLCMQANASLSVIFLCGSSLEGILLCLANQNLILFNTAKSAPDDKKTGKVRTFDKWTLNNFIDVAHEVGFIKEDVKNFSHVLRDFRNYIHHYEQMKINFIPDKHTAKICFQVLKAAIAQIVAKQRCV